MIPEVRIEMKEPPLEILLIKLITDTNDEATIVNVAPNVVKKSAVGAIFEPGGGSIVIVSSTTLSFKTGLWKK